MASTFFAFEPYFVKTKRLQAEKDILERDIEAVKVQRAEMFREITHLKDSNDQKTREACSQAEQLKGLDLEISSRLLGSCVRLPSKSCCHE